MSKHVPRTQPVAVPDQPGRYRYQAACSCGWVRAGPAHGRRPNALRWAKLHALAEGSQVYYRPTGRPSPSRDPPRSA